MLEKELPRATVTNKSRRLARGEPLTAQSEQKASSATEGTRNSIGLVTGSRSNTEIELPACRSLQTADSSPHGSAEQEKQHSAEERRQGIGMEGEEEGRKGRPDDLVYRRLDRAADKRAADSGREQ